MEYRLYIQQNFKGGSMNNTLIIQDVNLKLLEKQRITLITIQDSALFDRMPQHQQDCISGISNMLNAWSDDRYREGDNHESNTREDEVYTKDTAKYPWDFICE